MDTTPVAGVLRVAVPSQAVGWGRHVVKGSLDVRSGAVHYLI